MARILVVDDAPDIRMLVRQVLGMQGHHIVEAAGGRAALAELDSGRTIDLVILDVQMPDLDGWMTLASIRGNVATAGTPVILCSVRDGVVARGRIGELEAEAYINKPFDVEDLRREVEGVLNRASGDQR